MRSFHTKSRMIKNLLPTPYDPTLSIVVQPVNREHQAMVSNDRELLEAQLSETCLRLKHRILAPLESTNDQILVTEALAETIYYL